MIAGANRDDYHLRNVTPGEDFAPEYFDLRQVSEGDACRECGAILTLSKTVEIGHIFKLGYKYSQSMGLHVTNEAGEEVAPIMGFLRHRHRAHSVRGHRAFSRSGRNVAAGGDRAVYGNRHAGELQRYGAARSGRTDLSRVSRQRGSTRLLDDRDERPGVKFKDADLIGHHGALSAGKKLAQGLVEVIERGSRRKRTCRWGKRRR